MVRVYSDSGVECVESWELPDLNSNTAFDTELESEPTLEIDLEQINTQDDSNELQSAKQAALEELAKEMHEQVVLLKNIVKEVQGIKQAVTEQFESEMLDLFEEMLAKLVRRDLELNRDKLKSIIMQALTMLPSSENEIKLLLSEDDFEPVAALLAGVLDHISVDPQLDQGDFKLQLNESIIDGTVTRRVNNLITQMTAGTGDPDA